MSAQISSPLLIDIEDTTTLSSRLLVSQFFIGCWSVIDCLRALCTNEALAFESDGAVLLVGQRAILIGNVCFLSNCAFCKLHEFLPQDRVLVVGVHTSVSLNTQLKMRLDLGQRDLIDQVNVAFINTEIIGASLVPI